MPRYFFDRDDGRETHDADGRELADRSAAQRHALALATDLIRDDRLADTDGSAVIVRVRDEAGQPVLTAHLVSGIDVH